MTVAPHALHLLVIESLGYEEVDVPAVSVWVQLGGEPLQEVPECGAGSVAAFRATEKGYAVGVMESGRRWSDDDIPNRDRVMLAGR